MAFFKFILMVCGVACFSAAVSAQSTPSAETAALAQGWTLLSKGDAAGASGLAGQQLARDPFNAGALVLLIEAEAVRGGATPAIAAYDRWIGTRRLDNAYVLRRVARAVLTEASVSKGNPAARIEALKALAKDGDMEAIARLEEGAQSPTRIAEARALASMGTEKTVKMLIAQLDTFPGPKTHLIEALGESGSTLAVAPLKKFLSDPNDINRSTAAEALGRLGAREAASDLRPLLKDPNFTVKLKTAGALLRLNDMSGLGFLTELTTSEHAGIRIAAAKELAAQPDAAWQTLVRSLASDPDPSVRLEAARLIAPYDHQLASNVIDALMKDPNVGIREAASDVMVERVASDFATLRRMLHSGDPLVKVRAAGRILEITRS